MATRENSDDFKRDAVHQITMRGKHAKARLRSP